MQRYNEWLSPSRLPLRAHRERRLGTRQGWQPTAQLRSAGEAGGWWGWGAGRTWGRDLIVFVGPRVGYLTDLVPPGEGILWIFLRPTWSREFKIRRLRTMDYELRLDERCPLFVALGESCKYKTSRLHYSRLREKRRRGKRHAKIFLFSSHFTKIPVSFACDLIFRTMNKFFDSWRKQLRRVKLVNKVLAYVKY